MLDIREKTPHPYFSDRNDHDRNKRGRNHRTSLPYWSRSQDEFDTPRPTLSSNIEIEEQFETSDLVESTHRQIGEAAINLTDEDRRALQENGIYIHESSSPAIRE